MPQTDLEARVEELERQLQLLRRDHVEPLEQEVGGHRLQWKELLSADNYIRTERMPAQVDSAGNVLRDAGSELFDVANNTSTQKVRISKAGTLIGTRHEVNLIEGDGITLTVADDSGNDRVNVTVTGSAKIFELRAPVGNTLTVGSTGNASILNLTDSGVLRAIGIRPTVAIGGSPDVELRFVIDSRATVTVPIYEASNQWSTTLKALSRGFSTATGQGSLVSDNLILDLWDEFTTTITVDLHVTTAGSSGTLSVTALYELEV